MEIFFTDRTAMTHAPGAAQLPGEALRAFAALNVPKGMPFFVDAGGRYPQLLNAFLRDLPILGCPSPNTWRAYAMDLQGLLLHLNEIGCPRDILHLEFDDMRSYRDRRRNGEPPEVSAASWNRCLAALQKFFEWAVDKGHRERSPFRFRSGIGRYGGTARINSLHDREPVDDEIKCVSLAHFKAFRSVGLGGMAIDGQTLDPQFHRRNTLRNVTIADLLFSTGLRVTEGISIMRAEVPPTVRGVAGSGAHLFRVAGHTAKRRRPRTVLIPSRQLGALARYADEDRAGVVATAAERGIYDFGRNWRPMEHVTGRKARLLDVPDEHPKQYDVLDAELRRSLLVVDDLGRPKEPAALFLNEDGRPMTGDNVRAIFSRASDRCSDLFREEFDISPHTLRHTFAVHMLSVLLREHLRIKELSQLRAQCKSVGADVFRELAINPLRILMTLLGHKSVETTYGYLTHIVDVGEVAGAAALAFDGVLVDARAIARNAVLTMRQAAGDAEIDP